MSTPIPQDKKIEYQPNNDQEEVKQDAEDLAEVPESSLYHFMSDNRETLVQAGHGFKTVEEEETEYYHVIQIKEAPHYNLHKKQGYACVKRELRIYLEAEPGVSQKNIDKYISARYFETYQNKDGAKIEVSLSFNRFGQYLDQEQRQAVDIFYGDDLICNSQKAKSTIQKLLEMKAQAYFKLREELVLLWLGVKHGTTSTALENHLVEHLEYHNKFRRKKAELCRYSDLDETQHAFQVSEAEEIFTSHHFFEKHKRQASGAPKTLEPEGQTFSKEEWGKIVRANCLDRLQLIQKLDDRLKNLEASESVFTLKGKIAVFQCVTELKVLLRDLTVLRTSIDDKANAESVEIVVRHINSRLAVTETEFPKRFIELATECVEKGAFAEFQSLWPYRDYAILRPALLNQWHGILLNERNPAIMQGSIAICRFLFEKSDDYRHFCACTHMVVNYLEETHSLLWMALWFNRFDLFAMFLEHAYCLESEGVMHQGQFFTTFQYGLQVTERDNFAELLLEYHPLIDPPRFKKDSKTFKTVVVFKDPGDKQSAIMAMRKGFESGDIDLWNAWNYSVSTILPTLQSRTDIVKLALTVGTLLASSEAMIAYQTQCCISPGTSVVEDHEEAVKLDWQRARQFQSQNSYQALSVIIYPKIKLIPGSNEAKQFEFLKKLLEIFQSKYQAQRMNNLDKMIQGLMIKTQALEKDITQAIPAISRYFACITLIIQKEKLNQNEMHQVMQCYARMADIYEKLGNNKEKIVCYGKILAFIPYIAYKAHLETTPEYKKAIAHRLNPPSNLGSLLARELLAESLRQPVAPIQFLSLNSSSSASERKKFRAAPKKPGR